MITNGIPGLLEDIGFKKNSIVEAILVTKNKDGSVNPAPMGVTRVKDNIVKLKPFKSSKTHQNLTINRMACINTTQDPLLFLATAFKEEINEIDFGQISSEMRILRAEAHIFIKIIDVKEISKYRSTFLSEVSSIELIDRVPKVFSRGRASSIDAIIHATRLKVFKDKKGERTDNLLEKFQICKKNVYRVSSKKSDAAKVINILQRLIKKWGY